MGGRDVQVRRSTRSRHDEHALQDLRPFGRGLAIDQRQTRSSGIAGPGGPSTTRSGGLGRTSDKRADMTYQDAEITFRLRDPEDLEGPGQVLLGIEAEDLRGAHQERRRDPVIVLAHVVGEIPRMARVDAAVAERRSFRVRDREDLRGWYPLLSRGDGSFPPPVGERARSGDVGCPPLGAPSGHRPRRLRPRERRPDHVNAQVSFRTTWQRLDLSRITPLLCSCPETPTSKGLGGCEPDGEHVSQEGDHHGSCGLQGRAAALHVVLSPRPPAGSTKLSRQQCRQPVEGCVSAEVDDRLAAY